MSRATWEGAAAGALAGLVAVVAVTCGSPPGAFTDAGRDSDSDGVVDATDTPDDSDLRRDTDDSDGRTDSDGGPHAGGPAWPSSRYASSFHWEDADGDVIFDGPDRMWFDSDGVRWFTTAYDVHAVAQAMSFYYVSAGCSGAYHVIGIEPMVAFQLPDGRVGHVRADAVPVSTPPTYRSLWSGGQCIDLGGPQPLDVATSILASSQVVSRSVSPPVLDFTPPLIVVP